MAASEECRVTEVRHGDESLDAENGEYVLSSLTGSVSIIYEAREPDELRLFDGKPMVFKSRDAWSGDARRVSGIARGHYLVIVPKNWQRTGPAPVAPEGCTDTDFMVHYFYAKKGESARDAGGFEEHDIAWTQAGFELSGDRIFDDAEEGELFIGAAPKLNPVSGVVWARVGEERKGGWRGENFKPAERSLAAALSNRQGRFFIRVYDCDTRLLDSGEFRYLCNLREIRVNGELYTENMLLIPSSTGYPRTEVQFLGANGNLLRPRLETDGTHATVTPAGAVVVAPHPQGDDISCTLESAADSVNSAIRLPRIWWRMRRDEKTWDEWRDAPLALTRQQFREHANAQTVIRLRLPRRITSVKVGFDDELDRAYSPPARGDETDIRLADFADYSQIDQRSYEAATLNVQCNDAVLALIRVSADSESTTVVTGAGAMARPLAEQPRVVPAPSQNPVLDGPDTPLKWPSDLMPFQKDGVRALIDSERLLLADDMGLGKTLQAIAAARILCAQGVIDAILVVAPASLLDQWRRELEKWAPELRAIIVRGPKTDRAWQWEAKVHVTLVSYETLRSDFGANKRTPVRRKIWDVVIADEAQRIKNRNATSGALKGLQRRRSWALTGTPLENDEEELASILEFVDHTGLTSSRHYRPGVDLLRRHRQLQLRRKKGDVLDDLPPKQVTKVFVPLQAGQRDSYDRAEREGVVYLRSLGAQVRVQHVLELITRLKQICNADPETGQSSKLRDIRERLAQLVAQGHRALIFSQYTSATFGVAAAAGHLEAFNPLTLTGDMDPSQRAGVIERFKTADAHKALVLSLRAGGVGLNLQEASYVFHLDRWWNPAVEHQAEDRSHRFGQTAKVNVIKYACTGTIEERIDAILKRKQDLFDELIDDVSLNLSARLSSEEIFGLFGLEPPHN